MRYDDWIVYGALIKDGVSIGDRVVIDPGAVLTKDFPNFKIVATVPAKVLRYRFNEDFLSMLIKIQWWNNENVIIKNNIETIQTFSIKKK